jgi:pyruvate/2-oxoglutarate dehydrogenase complex dihydrolipoamide dehydrogenase (E3) component
LEKNKIGGECTNSSYIPGKTLLYSAKNFKATKHLRKLYGLQGLQISGKLNFSFVLEHVDDVIQSVYNNGTPDIFEKLGIDAFVNENGAKFIGKHSVARLPSLTAIWQY